MYKPNNHYSWYSWCDARCKCGVGKLLLAPAPLTDTLCPKPSRLRITGGRDCIIPPTDDVLEGDGNVKGGVLDRLPVRTAGLHVVPTYGPDIKGSKQSVDDADLLDDFLSTELDELDTCAAVCGVRRGCGREHALSSSG